MSEIVIEQPRGLGAFTIGDLGVFIGTIGGVVTSILIVLQKSRCKKIRCCGLQCDRDPAQPEEVVNNNNENNNNENNDNDNNNAEDDEEQVIPPANP